MTPYTTACQASLSITNSQSLLKFMSIEWVMPSNHLILCRPLLFLPSVFPSIRVFSIESALRIRWPKDWSVSFSISPSSEYSGLISSGTDCFDLLTVQRTVLLNSYLGIIFFFLITPVVLGCHHLLVLLWCVSLFGDQNKTTFPRDYPTASHKYPSPFVRWSCWMLFLHTCVCFLVFALPTVARWSPGTNYSAAFRFCRPICTVGAKIVSDKFSGGYKVDGPAPCRF